MMDFPELLRTIYPMSDEAIALIKPYVEKRKVPAFEIIIEEGKPTDEIFFVKSGVLRNFAGSGKKEHTRWFATEGDIFTSMYSFTRGLPAMSSVDTLVDVELYVAPIEVVKKLIVENKEWAVLASQYLIEGLYILERKYASWGNGDAFTRYTNHLKMRTPDILNEIQLQHIASYLNVTPQTISRVRRKIAKKK